jgi:hypothetical protein
MGDVDRRIWRRLGDAVLVPLGIGSAAFLALFLVRLLATGS